MHLNVICQQLRMCMLIFVNVHVLVDVRRQSINKYVRVNVVCDQVHAYY